MQPWLYRVVSLSPASFCQYPKCAHAISCPKQRKNITLQMKMWAFFWVNLSVFSEYLLVIHCPLHQSGQVVEAPSDLYLGYSADSQAPRLKTTRGPPPLRFHSAYGWSGNQQFAVGFWWIALIEYELIFPLKSLVGFLRIQHSFPSEHAT